MKLSNYSIMLPIGELRMAENPNFVPGELYRWTDVWTKKSYVLELRSVETVTLSESEKVVTVKQVQPEEVQPRRNKKLYEAKLTLKESEEFRKWFMYAKFKVQMTYQEIAERAGINVNSLRLYCCKPLSLVPVVVRTRLHRFFVTPGNREEVAV